ncbi:MAG: SusC/RagA family TonB-linked outer membrane protein [Clostridium sp.]|nr:SusC/RagA family TonB-linked outer membrane protein [Clostridium sp.]
MKQTFYMLTLLLMTALQTVCAQTENRTVVTGQLVFAEDDFPIIGANCVEIDKNKRIVGNAITDINGNFSLVIKNPANQIRFSYTGCTTVQLPIGNRRVFNVKMQDTQVLQTVNVVAQKKYTDGTLSIPQREISGAVQTINTKAFEGMSVASIDDALQGRIAGLDIVASSGDVGSGTSMRIRGVTSINCSSTPLILLNDIPFESNVESSFDFNNADNQQFAQLLSISPDDIEEITVLKDGAAAAIWGSRGANGVISIKTKKGVRGPTTLSYSYRFSGHKQPAGLKMLNGDDYTMMMKQALFNRRYDEADCDIPEFNYDRNFPLYEMYNNNTDWVKEVTQFGLTHDHTLSVSGGGEKARFRASLGYYNQTGTVIEQEMKRYSARMNLDYFVSNRITFTTDFSMTYTNNDKSYTDLDNGDYPSLLDMAYRKAPNISVYQQDANGNDLPVFFTIPQDSRLLDSQRDLLNPVAVAKLATYRQTNLRIIPTLRLRVDLLDPDKKAQLRYNGYVSFDIENNVDRTFFPRELTSKPWPNEWANRAQNKEAEGLSILTDQNITYVPDLGKDHSLTLYASWQLTSGNSQYQNFLKYGLPSQQITNATTEGYTAKSETGKGQWRSMAYLARAHYAYKERYIVDATIRRDGSTQFGEKNRWGTFPAVSGKWLITEESFMESSAKWLNMLGLRFGWGVTGNQPGREYLHFSRYNGSWSTGSNNYIDMPTIKPVSLKLSNLKWERSSSYNVGLDVGLFNNKVTMEANVYYRRTEDLLFADQAIPSSTGYSTISYINAGTMDNKGWEINLNTNNLVKVGKFSFDVNVNLANNVNSIVKLEPSVLDSYNGTFDYNNGTYLTRIQEGNAFGSIYGFKYKGVYRWDKYEPGREGMSPYALDAAGNVIKDNNGEPIPMYFAYNTTSAVRFHGGDAIYEDINHDGTIDELDIVYLGNSTPKLTGGFGFTARYKNFTLNTFFNFRYGNKIINKARMNAENMYANDNQSVAVNYRWRQDGDENGMLSRALYQDGRNWLGSDRYVEDGSFLRWKQLTLIYNMPVNLIKRAGFRQLSFNLTLNNMLTFTKYTGVDPEVDWNNRGICEDNSKTPRSKYFTFGVTVGF